MRSFIKRLVIFMGLLAVANAPAFANTGAWQVVEMQGAVNTVQPATGMQLVSTGGTLDPGAVLTTGKNGRAVLARGEQTIVVGPSSRMSLPAAEEPGITRIFQDLGTLLFKVDKQDKQHFRVETPVIAAVVKGTTFTVSANANSHAVHVAEGAVEVSSLNGASVQMVTAGMTARVFKSNPSAIEMNVSTSGDGRGQQTETGGTLTLPTEIGAKQLDVANLTDGFVSSPKSAANSVTRAQFDRDESDAQNRGIGGQVSEIRRATNNNNGSARAAEVRQNNTSERRPVTSNAGGNGNGNANGTANSDAGNNGNANGNANTAATTTAGLIGNGNGNANGAANSNAGSNGNGNGNANGAANSNAGNNGNGNGNGGNPNK